ncbi:MAG: Uma2 family endonuclease [Planctomycetes bacterium]|nr:Uma2 family endonuclease [Planctomycetota bacterium]
MAVTSPEQARAPMPSLARLDVDQYHSMLEAGILGEGDPIELLDGLLVHKDRSARGENPMTIGKRHRAAVDLLAGLDALVKPHGCYVMKQGPVTFPPSHEPEPDGLVVRGQTRDYLERHPGPADVFCVIEVADSSLDHDRTNKLQIYAAAAIPQYVIVNLVDLQVEVFESPVPAEGKYSQVRALQAGAALPLHVGGGKRVDVPVRDLLP